MTAYKALKILKKFVKKKKHIKSLCDKDMFKAELNCDTFGYIYISGLNVNRRVFNEETGMFLAKHSVSVGFPNELTRELTAMVIEEFKDFFKPIWIGEIDNLEKWERILNDDKIDLRYESVEIVDDLIVVDKIYQSDLHHSALERAFDYIFNKGSKEERKRFIEVINKCKSKLEITKYTPNYRGVKNVK